MRQSEVDAARISTHPLPLEVSSAVGSLAATFALIDEAIARLTAIVDSQAQRIARLEARVDTLDDDSDRRYESVDELGSSS